MNEQKYIDAYHVIKNANNILLTIHAKPDGDAVSSANILIELLINLNKKFFAYSKDITPTSFDYLLHTEKISQNINNKNFFDFDVIIALDCGSLSRTNLIEQIKNKNKNQITIEFDHHPKVDDYANIEIREPQMSSTAEVLYYFLKYNKIKFNKNFANSILTGILTDTGNLLYDSTTSKTMDIVSEMLLYGAKYSQIIQNTWRNKSLNGLKVWGLAMKNLQINKKYNFAFSILTFEELEKNKVDEDEIEGIASFLSTLEDINVVLFLREEKKGKLKGSLRTSKKNIDVSKLAQKLGGGGHIKASGFNMDGEIKRINNKYIIN